MQTFMRNFRLKMRLYYLGVGSSKEELKRLYDEAIKMGYPKLLLDARIKQEKEKYAIIKSLEEDLDGIVCMSYETIQDHKAEKEVFKYFQGVE